MTNCSADIERAKALADKLEPLQYAVGIPFNYLDFRLVIDALRAYGTQPAGETIKKDGKQFINEILAWYAGKNITPGEGWAFTDDNSSLCFEDSHRVTGHALWVDLEDDGEVNVLFRPNDKTEARSIRFVAPHSPAVAATPSIRQCLEHAQRIIERDFPNGQLAIDIRNALAVPNGVAQPSLPPYAEWRESIGIVLYNREKFRAVHAGQVLSAAAGKQVTGADMEPWEECCETFLSDADAVIDFLRTSPPPSTDGAGK